MNAQVFISYAHADNKVFDEGTSGWVSGFVDKLQKAIAMKHGGSQVDCWMDFRLEPQRAVDEELRRRIRESKCIVAFMSPRYLESKWCCGEMAAFVEQMGGSAHDRVFLVEILPTDRKLWHSGIRLISTVKLWCNGLEQPEAMTLGWPAPNPKEDKDYWKQLNRLADTLARQIQNLPPEPPAVAVPAVPPPVSAAPAAKVVWIADPTDDMLEQHETLAAMLQNLGHRVLPADSYPHRQAEPYRQALDGDLKQADLLVQLLGSLPGRKPAWSDARFVQLQADAASAEVLRRNLPLRLWRLPEIDLDAVADPVYRALLQRAVTCDWDAFQRQLADLLADRSLSPARSPLGVVINADKPDRELGKRVQDMLGDLEVDAILAAEPLPTQLPADYRKDLEAQLDDSQGVLIVYGAAPPSWVQAQYARARKVLAFNRRSVWGALLDGPPEHKPDHGINNRNLMLLNCRQGVAVGVLQDFVAKLGQEVAHV